MKTLWLAALRVVVFVLGCRHRTLHEADIRQAGKPNGHVEIVYGGKELPR